jgi:death-on-curing protein
MKRWRWIELDVLYAIHDRQLAEHGGLSGVRDRGLIESAMGRPRNLAAYESEPDAATLAAAYAYGLVRNHGFMDGKKRVGWVMARLFLADNRYRLRFEPVEAIRLMEGVAAGEISEKQLAGWIRERITAARRRG